MTSKSLFLVALIIASTACGDNSETAVAPGIFADLGEPLPSASPAQKVTFVSGREVALRRFTIEDGLGDHFNVTFCAACHEKPVFGGGAGRYRNFLLVGEELSDGSFTPTGVNGVQAQFSHTQVREPTDDGTNVIATRNPIPFFGIGLIAEISDEEILSREDPDDVDGDGVSGRVNFDRGFVGRFGRKSQSVAIESFIRGPLFNHLGITSNPLSDERRSLLPVASSGGGASPRNLGPIADHDNDDSTFTLPQVGAPDEPLEDTDGVADPELSEDDLFEVVSFAMLMAAPRPEEPTADSEAGKKLFDEIGCEACHVTALRGPRGMIPAYTDLLLHDMGPELADGIVMSEATGSEFRTSPLWGITAVAPYLHDGRADTLHEAIEWHGGEGTSSRDRYRMLSAAERDQVIAFLVSLGGGSQRSEGLLGPDAPIPDAGEFGGPAVALSAPELERFARGRAVFDFDFAIEGGGLGPRFNGDACRACHFDPVIGGSGPADVNVIRHGMIDTGSGEFTVPDIGTMAHRFSALGAQRPPVDPNANLFVPMQTPPLFGLGLVDQIPESAIEANADPDDDDDDGISGRVRRLSDNRVGRLGWRAQVPNLAEFARDALTAEMGLTVPAQEGLTFGAAEDGDQTADPEISVADVEDLTFFMSQLAPPPRLPLDEDIAARGEAAFSAAGCASCHIPSLKTESGADVDLFSDLLLHNVARDGAFDIQDGSDQNDFRTPPLWGLRVTAPYMHNGLADSIEAAILMHTNEAQDSRDAYLELSFIEQVALLAFLHSL